MPAGIRCVLVNVSNVATQGGYDAGYLYECAIGRVGPSSEIVASEPLRAVPLEHCDEIPVTNVKIGSRFITLIYSC